MGRTGGHAAGLATCQGLPAQLRGTVDPRPAGRTARRQVSPAPPRNRRLNERRGKGVGEDDLRERHRARRERRAGHQEPDARQIHAARPRRSNRVRGWSIAVGRAGIGRRCHPRIGAVCAGPSPLSPLIDISPGGRRLGASRRYRAPLASVAAENPQPAPEFGTPEPGARAHGAGVRLAHPVRGMPTQRRSTGRENWLGSAENVRGTHVA